MSQPRKPWEQQPGETVKAFGSFVAYLGLGERRSHGLAAAECGLPKTTVERFSRKWTWPRRISAWQSHLLAVQLVKAERVVGEMPAEWAKRVEVLRSAEWEAASKGLELARQEIARILKLKRRGVSLSDINRLLEVCSKLGRLATGLATERGELTGADGEPIRVEVAAAIAKVYGVAAVNGVAPAAGNIPGTIPGGAICDAGSPAMISDQSRPEEPKESE